MGTGRKFRKHPRMRVKKNPSDRRRREKIQRNRLIARGMDPEVVRRLTTRHVRELLKRPFALPTTSSVTTS